MPERRPQASSAYLEGEMADRHGDAEQARDELTGLQVHGAARCGGEAAPRDSGHAAEAAELLQALPQGGVASVEVAVGLVPRQAGDAAPGQVAVRRDERV